MLCTRKCPLTQTAVFLPPLSLLHIHCCQLSPSITCPFGWAWMSVSLCCVCSKVIVYSVYCNYHRNP
ncbi:hypothetical protein RSAG8_13316, partial [Rhizoctonia solani AG-8 WAC10335]